MKRFILILISSFLIPQNPVSDQGLDQIVEPGSIVTISGADSYAVDGNSIVSYQWSVHQDILDSNPGLDLTS